MSKEGERKRLDELAALGALDLLDAASRERLANAARLNPAVEAIRQAYEETAAALAYAAPPAEPPASLRQAVLRQIEPEPRGRTILYARFLPYAIAAGLMALVIAQALQVRTLRGQYFATSAEADRLRASNALLGLRVAELEMAPPAKTDVTYANSKVMVAWDPNMNKGMLEMHNMPAAPDGHTYQLWVLDPNAPAPMSAGVVSASGPFTVNHVSTRTPGFAVSMEPEGGRPEPTGPILFAIAPGL